MTADTLLSRLEKVKRTGQNRWQACCPAHPDRRPSLHIRETDDGRVLVHCFTGCDVHSIVAAVGLELTDLFPEKFDADVHHQTGQRRDRFPATAVLRTLAFEVSIVVLAAEQLHTRGFLSADDDARLIQAHDRIAGALLAVENPSYA